MVTCLVRACMWGRCAADPCTCSYVDTGQRSSMCSLIVSTYSAGSRWSCRGGRHTGRWWRKGGGEEERVAGVRLLAPAAMELRSGGSPGGCRIRLAARSSHQHADVLAQLDVNACTACSGRRMRHTALPGSSSARVRQPASPPAASPPRTSVLKAAGEQAVGAALVARPLRRLPLLPFQPPQAVLVV